MGSAREPVARAAGAGTRARPTACCLPDGLRRACHAAQSAPARGGGPAAARGVERTICGEIHLQLMGEVQLEILTSAYRGTLRRGRARLTRAASSTSETIADAGRWASAISSRCGTTPRCICCSSRPSAAAAFSLSSACPTDVLDLQLAAPDPHASGGKDALRRADRRAHHGCEDNAACRPRARQAHRGRRLPARRPTAPSAAA